MGPASINFGNPKKTASGFPRGPCAILGLALVLTFWGCEKCGGNHLQPVPDCNVAANRNKPEICNDKDDNCNCAKDTNGDGVVCGPGDEGVDEGCDDDGDGYCDADMTIEGRPQVCPRTFETCAATTGPCATLALDCKDDDPTVHPGAPELCDGKDNDCNGAVDDNVTPESDPRIGQPCGGLLPDQVNVGECREGKAACSAGGELFCQDLVTPKPETCDGKDNDCNGLIDDGSTLFELCWHKDNSLLGECRPGTARCENGKIVGGELDDPKHLIVCKGEVFSAAEQCDGKDHDCDGKPATNCGPAITCPPDVSTPVGVPVTLTVNAVVSYATIASYQWSIISAPPGGIGTAGQWAPAPPNAATETFLAQIVGVYTIRVTVFDSNGASASCEMRVTVENRGLHVELMWDGNGDLDAHLHNGTTTPWFGAAGGADCFYGNTFPDWDQAWIATDNPQLDVDNTTSNGPENIRIEIPVLGRTYAVGVHNYGGGQGRSATIKIYCGVTTTPAATYISRPFNGEMQGRCTNNDFWYVANVVFSTSSGYCAVTPVNAWSESWRRCQNF